MLTKDIGLLLGVIMCWGVWGVLEKRILVLTGASSYLLLFAILQAFISIPLYYAFWKASGDSFIVTKSSFLLTLLLIVMLTLSYVMYANLLHSNSAGKIVVLTSVYPLVTLLLAVIFFKDALTLKASLGACLIFIGMLLVL